MENKFNTPWSPVGDKTRFGYMLNCNGNRLDLEHSQLLNRVAQCVNACAGMDDPVADVAELKRRCSREALLKAIRRVKSDPRLNIKHGLIFKPLPPLEPSYDEQELASEISSALCDGSTETLNKAIAHAKECGFSFADGGITAADWPVKNTPEFFVKNPESKPWHENGEFPPVGTECEINEPSMSYDGRKVHVFAHYNGRAFAWDPIENSAYHSDKPSEFRPIQTEKQKTIKGMLEWFDGFFDGYIPVNSEEFCEKIYDQFIANKKEK